MVAFQHDASSDRTPKLAHVAERYRHDAFVETRDQNLV
jgi:hypothetical protein